jgi:hypothetical protein
MEWALPFVYASQSKFDISKIVTLRGYALKPKQHPHSYGTCLRSKGKYDVVICLGHTNKLYPVSLILEALAHELAHLVYWEHEPAHLSLTAEIVGLMADQAQLMGIKDMSKALKRKKL